MLQAEYPTAQFTQLMALLEFLADPTDYTKAGQVGQIIGRYVAKNSVENEKFKTRCHELSGKRDSATGEHVGYRTRIVHRGAKSSWTFDSYEQNRSAIGNIFTVG
jgi:hypothetical protein